MEKLAVKGWRAILSSYAAQAAALATLCLAVLMATGVYLLAAYRISPDPYAAVAALDHSLLGRTLRSLHRYAADAMLLLTAVHCLREAAAGHYHGTARGAWVTGVLATALLLAIGVTGYVLPWDRLAYAVLSALTRVLDAWPVFSEPPSRALLPGRVTPWLFFFALFAHAVLAFWLVVILGAHAYRVVRPRLWPGRWPAGALLAALLLIAAAFPVASQGPADPGRVPPLLLIDRFYLFWLPWVERMHPLAATAALVGSVVALSLIPFLPWPRGSRRGPAPRGSPGSGRPGSGPGRSDPAGNLPRRGTG